VLTVVGNIGGFPIAGTFTNLPNGGAITASYNGTPYAFTANYFGGTGYDLTLTFKAAATVTLGNLATTYNGIAQAATATTNPPGLNVTFTYNGSPIVPTNAGSYTVVGTINDPDYQGSATGTLVIGQATATLTLGNLIAAYGGAPNSATATTNPSGLNVTFTYNGSAIPPSAPGSYTVVGTINDPNAQGGSATGTLIITATLSQWETLCGLTGDSTVLGPTATPENDGIPNLLKYLYNINPSAPMNATDHAALPTVGIDTTTLPGTQYLTLTYRENVALDPTQITINVQTSSDLQTWTTVSPPDLSQQVGTDPTTGDPIIEVGVKANGLSGQFIRLNVTTP